MASGTIWVVRAGKGGKAVEDFERSSIVAIGWVEVGDCTGLVTREDFKRKMLCAGSWRKPDRRSC